MWLYLPSSTSAFSAEQAGSTSLSESQTQTLAVSAMWRSKPRLLAFWRRAWQKVRWMRLLSGVTCEPSQANSIVTAWLESLGASRVPIIPLPVNAPESPASTDSSGTPCGASFATFSPDGRTWKTYRESLFPTGYTVGDGIVADEHGRHIVFLPDCGLFLETWPRWGSIVNGVAFERPAWEPHINGTDGSVTPGEWPTATANEREHTRRVRRHGTKHGCANLADDVTAWKVSDE